MGILYIYYTYDETNITDGLGVRKVFVPRNSKRVECVQNYSRTTISIMVCGSASGVLLPPIVVNKANSIYENWCTGGPPGTVYKNSPSSWFDANLFEIWFKEMLLSHVLKTREPGKMVILIGDNLARHLVQVSYRQHKKMASICGCIRSNEMEMACNF